MEISKLYWFVNIVFCDEGVCMYKRKGEGHISYLTLVLADSLGE